MRYILAYFALMVGLSGLGMLIAGEPLGFLLILVAALLIYWIFRLERERRRDRRYGAYWPAIEGYEKHFSAASEALEAKLPQDALENPALLELLSGEDMEGAEAIRAEYARLRERFHEWREDFERMREQSAAGAIGLPGPFAEHYERLDRELSELLDEVERLEVRAAEARGFGDNPLEELARAALKHEQATALSQSAFAGAVPAQLAADLAHDLAQAEEKLTQARLKLEKGAEQPLVAARLAREAFALADGVSKRVRKLVDEPREAGARRAELDRTFSRVAGDVASARSNHAVAVEHYAPSCLLAIAGLDSSAEQALEEARALIASADAPTDAYRLEEAQESLKRAAELATRIQSHLTELEATALQTPTLLEEAELATDRAWANATAAGDTGVGAESIVARARELSAQARSELQQPRPDWLHARSLAKRALEVVRELMPAGAGSALAAATDAEVEAARRGAEESLTEVSSLVAAVEGPAGAENMASLCLERGDFAYSKGLELQRELAGADDPDTVKRAAMESFGLATEAAAAAEEHALRLQSQHGGDGRTPRWGKFGTAFGSD